jgi:hypothetical protein
MSLILAHRFCTDRVSNWHAGFGRRRIGNLNENDYLTKRKMGLMDATGTRPIGLVMVGSLSNGG